MSNKITNEFIKSDKPDKLLDVPYIEFQFLEVN